MAFPSANCRRATGGRATRLVAARVCLPAALRRRLLFQPSAQPFPAALRLRTQGGADRPPGRHQPAHGLASARHLFQGDGSGGAPPHGRPAPRQVAAALCRSHRRVHLEPCRRHALRHPRLHRAHLGRARLDGSLAPLLQEVWPRSGHTSRGDGLPAQRGPHARRAAPRRNGPSEPARAAAASPFFSTRTHYAGAFLLMPPALDWLTAAEHCFADDYGSLGQGLLTSVFSLVVGMERVFHLDEMEDPGFARLCGGRRCPSRYPVGAWRRHLPWYEVDAFCRRTCPWHLLHNEDVLMSFDEHTIPRWTRKFHIGKGYVTSRNKYMRCEKLYTGYDVGSGRFLCVRATPGNCDLQELAVPLVQQVLRQSRPRSVYALFDAGAGKSDAGVRGLWDLAA